MYTTCLISDADHVMIDGLLNQVSFDRVYLSEDYKVYKSDIKGTLFRSAIRDFDIDPCQMIHIGDGYNDIVSAKQVGSNAVWVNRNNEAWNHAIRPDLIVGDLSEIEFF